MADMDPGLPSFSLGLDFDSPPPSPNVHNFDQAPGDGMDDEDFRTTDDPPLTLRRLRRGTRILRTPEACSPSFKLEDDIEEFSSEEEMGKAKKPSAQNRSLCGSSKLPLYRPCSIATTSCDQLNSAIRKLPSYEVGSSSQQASCNRLFKSSTSSSPVRKFVLVDSDSDDPSITKHSHGEEATKADFPAKRKLAASYSKPEKDLWRTFLPVKSFDVPTPAFDEVCNEYFLSAKDNVKNTQKPSTCSSLDDDVICLPQRTYNKTSQSPLLPSHQYFFHNDMRIRNLIRSRLPHFFPIGGDNNGELSHPNTSSVDYMGQFNDGDHSRNGGTDKIDKKKGSRGKAKQRASSVQEHTSVDNWMNPRSSASAPRNVGKRRVKATGKSAGHWYTGADGRKVYVTGNGQELTGSAAYRSYRKERGAGFKKSSKKPKGNKKAKR
ncbi:hypothetical protein SAY86_016163 [Trapa natans]|uniref:Uncharacterized protein n=1 Tax=Trapa natans TaxID=22666 RepID=A0AAN7LJT0_TRANT|nr:hypothetical protein SAY86_016163 [Trapa natans]